MIKKKKPSKYFVKIGNVIHWPVHPNSHYSEMDKNEMIIINALSCACGLKSTQ